MSDMLRGLNTRIWEKVSGWESDNRMYYLYMEAVKRDMAEMKPKVRFDDWSTRYQQWKMLNRILLERDILEDVDSYVKTVKEDIPWFTVPLQGCETLKDKVGDMDLKLIRYSLDCDSIRERLRILKSGNWL